MCECPYYTGRSAHERKRTAQACQRLRRECIPIGSSSNGYYFAETAAEVYDTIKNLRRIRDGIDAAITGLECSMISFRGGDGV